MNGEALRTWQRKLDFLEVEEAKVADPLIKFRIMIAKEEACAMIQTLTSKTGTSFAALSSGPAAARPYLDDFSNRMATAVREFVGRKWLFEKIESFWKDNPGRGAYVHITGMPGQGKTAIAAYIALRSNAIRHFCVQADDRSSPIRLAESLFTQAQGKYRLTNMPAPALGNISGLLKEISRELAPEELCVIVLDAIDEAPPEAFTSGPNPFNLPDTLPPRIFVVMTSRVGERYRLQKVSVETPVLLIKLHESSGQEADARQYIESQARTGAVAIHLEGRPETDRLRFVETLLARSESNFMYLRYVLPEVSGGFLRTQALSGLPQGLREYYERHWSEMKQEAGSADIGWKMTVMGTLATLREPFPATEILEVIKLVPLTAQQIGSKAITCQQSLVDATLEQLVQTLQQWQPFLLHRWDEARAEPSFRIYHLDYSDYLLNGPLRSPVDLYETIAVAYGDWLTQLPTEARYT